MREFRENQSILDNLDLQRRAEEAEPRDSPASVPPALRSREARAMLAPLLWEQLRGRASHVFTVDRKTMTVLRSYSDDPKTLPSAIVQKSQLWLQSLDKPAISNAIDIDGFQANLVATVANANGPRVLVAVVPVNAIASRFLGDVNKEDGMGAVLLDENSRIMIAPNPKMIGMTITADAADPAMRELARRKLSQQKPGTTIFEEPITIGGQVVKSAMVSDQKIDLPGKRWALLISSSLDEVDKVVSQVFRRAAFWAVFVIVSMTAVLVSTSVQTIRGRLRLERVRRELLTQELNQAREIQLAWLPERQGTVVATDIAAVNQPASHISGDFYNWFELPDGRTAVLIGDVTGHGMAAAFLMATTQLLVRSTMARISDPGKCLEVVNDQLCIQGFMGQFVTMLLMVIDTESKVVEVAAAGHPAPFVGQGDEFHPMPIEPQLVLGIDRGVRYKTQRVQLAANASILLYTDGVTDVLSRRGERFESEGLKKSLYGKFTTAQSILDTIVQAVDMFRQGEELPDDLTLVAIQLQSQPAPRVNQEVGVA